jgi:hypothetical protein
VSSETTERETPTAAPRMRVTFTFEYTPFVYADEGLTPEQIAQRDTDDMNCGDLQWDDLEGYSAIGMTVEPVPS